jgi:hypothetical protein
VQSLAPLKFNNAYRTEEAESCSERKPHFVRVQGYPTRKDEKVLPPSLILEKQNYLLAQLVRNRNECGKKVSNNQHQQFSFGQVKNQEVWSDFPHLIHLHTW